MLNSETTHDKEEEEETNFSNTIMMPDVLTGPW